MGGDASSMFYHSVTSMLPYKEELPVALQLVERGFDVWFTNNRGTQYSAVSNYTYDWTPTYWDFSFDTLGKVDNVANMKYIYDFTDGKKVSYYGYSLGTTQAFYSLAKLEDEFFAEHANAFALVAPCTIAQFPIWPVFNKVFMQIYNTLGVYAFNGPYWYQNLPTMCKAFGPESCAMLQALEYLTKISFKIMFH